MPKLSLTMTRVDDYFILRSVLNKCSNTNLKRVYKQIMDAALNGHAYLLLFTDVKGKQLAITSTDKPTKGVFYHSEIAVEILSVAKKNALARIYYNEVKSK